MGNDKNPRLDRTKPVPDARLEPYGGRLCALRHTMNEREEEKMKSIKRIGISASCALLLALVSISAYTQELTDREKEMMGVIEALKERVSALEEKVATPRAEQPEAPLNDRVEALENRVTVGSTPEPNDFRVFWKNGLNMETTDGETKLKIGGRIQNDWFWFDQDRSLKRMADQKDGSEFRRSRLYLSGTIYENINFKAQYDFAGGDADFKDVYLELANAPLVGNIQIGHFKEPFSLEELTSSKYITFMERALPGVFAPSRNSGVMIHRAFLGEKNRERMTAALGFFRTSDDFGSSKDDGGYSGTIRVTGLPWYAVDGRKLLHLGASYTHRNPGDTIRIRQRPEAHSAGHVVDTGEFDVKDLDSIVLETALVYGPFSVQGEYYYNDINTRHAGNREFDGYYLQTSYLLTGENRSYKNASGAFGGITPNRNFKLHGENRGWGAWEVALRYSTIDLNDGRNSILDRAFERNNQIHGGEEDNVTVGLNWYLNPNTRIMWNYVHANIDSDVYDGDLNIFQTRFQLAF